MATKKSAKKATAEAPVSGLAMVAVGKLIPSPDNPRKIDKKSAKFRELVASVKQHGVLVPILARPHPEKAGKLDVRAGHRRLAAAIEADLVAVPVITRPMTDHEAMEVTVIENLQREDLHPLEEARGVLAMIGQGRTAKEVGGMIGKSAQWVMRRAALASLSPSWAALADGASALLMDPSVPAEDNHGNEGCAVAHLELMARFPHDVQEQLHAELMGKCPHLLQAPRFHQFAAWVASSTARLRGAPFDPKRIDLVPGAGACTQCPKRSSCNPGLFDDELDAKRLKADDTCLDRACYNAKTAAALEEKFDALKKADARTVRVTTSYSAGDRGDGIYLNWEFIPAKKGEQKARPALMVDGPDAGKVNWVILNEDLRQKDDADEREDEHEDGEQPKDPETAKWITASGMLADRIELATAVGVTDAKTMLALLLAFNETEALNDLVDFEDGAASPFARVDTLATSETGKLLSWAWLCVRQKIANELRLYSHDHVTEQAKSDMRIAAGLCSIDIDALLAAAEAENAG